MDLQLEIMACCRRSYAILIDHEMKIAQIFIFLSIIAIDLKAIDLSGINFRYQYDPDAQVKLSYRLLQRENLYQLNFSVSSNSGDFEKLGTQLYVQSSYSDTTELNLQEALTSVEKATTNLNYVYNFSTDSTYKLAVVEITDSLRAKKYYFDISLSSPVDFPNPDFYPISEDGSVLYRTFTDERSKVGFSDSLITSYKYSQEFSAAMPPMADTRTNSRRLNIEDVTAVTDSFHLERGKFYFFQKDTSSFSGVGLLATTPLYPKLISLEEVIAPLIYISTTKEFDAIAKADEKKKAMDKFFLEIAGNRDRALNLIRRYFKRVRDANFFFTTYKEGWKTDRGMVYVVMGSPSRVSRNLVQERWTYRPNGSGEMTFIFDRVKNIFTNNHYTLRRSEDFSKDWFRQVDLWRKGRI